MRCRSILLATTVTLICSNLPAKADLIISISDQQLQPGSSGFVDVTIRSDQPGGDLLSIFGFEFRIVGSGPRRLEFVDPQPDPQLTDPVYVFLGDSQATFFPPVGTVGTTVVPRDTFVGGDATFSGLDVTVTSERLLARLEVTAVTALPPIAGDMFTISLEPTANTFFMDSASNSSPFSSSLGTVTVASASVVPEPASIVIFGLGGALLLATRCFRRTGKPAGAQTPG